MKKLSYAFVKDQIGLAGYKLLSDNYLGAYSPLQIMCPNGHKFELSWNSWKKGRRCKYCKGALYIPKLQHDLSVNGYELITDPTLITAKKDHFDVICPEGHKNSITANSWYKGTRCRDCYFNTIKITLTSLMILLESKGFTLIDVPKIFDSKTAIKCSCGAGHVFTTSWAKLKAGYGCKYCSLDKVKNKLKLSYEYIVEKFDEEQYTVITDEYINAFSKIKYICPNGHEGTVRWNDWQQGVRCSRCSVTVSKGHNYLISYIEDLGVEYLVNDRKLLGGLELDIVVPEKKIAIEYCGLYWHSEKAGKDSKYHIKKLDLCTEKGYKLITIFEDEFINKKKLVLTKIAYILGHKPPKRVYARQCVVGIVSSVASREFLSKHHIQSKDNSPIRLGLYFDSELVALMTFSKGNISKGSKAEELVWELNRFCVHKDYSVVAAGSKLLTYFKRNINWKRVFSYADRRWSTGNLYEQLGFDLVSKTSPNYWYTLDGKARIHRFNLRKTSKDPKYLTERQLRSAEGYYRIWDCGSLKYELLNTEEN